MENLQSELSAIATHVRQQLEPVWAADPNRLDYWPGRRLSYGQCGKSANALQEELTDPRFSVKRHLGRLAFSQERLTALEPHAWLEVNGLILDITADQEGRNDMPVVCATPEHLEQDGLFYTPCYTWDMTFVDNRWRRTDVQSSPTALEAWANRLQR